MPIVDSDYRRVSNLNGHGRRRELLETYRGRFCFPLGEEVACGGANSYSVSVGTTRTLQLTVPLQAVNFGASIQYTHTFEQNIGPWPLGDCDSSAPVLCFPNGELRIYRWRLHWRRFKADGLLKVFEPRSRCKVHPNILRNDPACDCHDPTRPTEVADHDPQEEQQCATRVALVQPFLVDSDPNGAPEDASAAASELAAQLHELLADMIDPAAMGSGIGWQHPNGAVTWQTYPGRQGPPAFYLLPYGVSGLRGSLTVEPDLMPFIVLGGPSDAQFCEASVFAQKPGQDSLFAYSQDFAVVHTDTTFTVAWYEVDLSDLPAGTTGFVELQLRTDSGAAVGLPLREQFLVDFFPVARQRQPA